MTACSTTDQGTETTIEDVTTSTGGAEQEINNHPRAKQDKVNRKD